MSSNLNIDSPFLVCILGPTAVGKTSVAVKLAQVLNAEVVSVDSRQVYQQISIGTAKPSQEEKDTVRHHLIDCVSIDQTFSVADYQLLADQAIHNIHNSNKRVLLVGGAGLYFRAIIDGLFDGPGADWQIRADLSQEAEKYGKDYLYEKLRCIDPISAGRIHPNNIPRIIRALEVYKLTGRPISGFQRNWDQNCPRYNFSAFGLTMPRKQLYHRIEMRIDYMLEIGWVDEVKGLLEGYNSDTKKNLRAYPAMQSYGYKEIIDYLDQRLDFVQAISQIKQRTRNYAKRQLTWFRKDSRINWLDVSEFDSVDQIIEKILTSGYEKNCDLTVVGDRLS
mgnify:FL=1